MQVQISNSMVLSSVIWLLPMGDLWFVLNFGEISPPKKGVTMTPASPKEMLLPLPFHLQERCTSVGPKGLAT